MDTELKIICCHQIGGGSKFGGRPSLVFQVGTMKRRLRVRNLGMKRLLTEQKKREITKVTNLLSTFVMAGSLPLAGKKQS